MGKKKSDIENRISDYLNEQIGIKKDVIKHTGHDKPLSRTLLEHDIAEMERHLKEIKIICENMTVLKKNGTPKLI